MRYIVACSLIALATACGGDEDLSPQFLFDTSRSDVAALRAADGTELGLVNTTHGVSWDYALGYSRFGVDREVVWGPVASIPRAELELFASRDGLLSVSDESAEQAATRRGGGTAGGGGAVAQDPYVCSCCYTRLDGTCGCILCVPR